jgi:hypothetical protein
LIRENCNYLSMNRISALVQLINLLLKEDIEEILKLALLVQMRGAM